MAGGEDPESVLSAFGWNVLQAALQVDPTSYIYISYASCCFGLWISIIWFRLISAKMRN